MRLVLSFGAALFAVAAIGCGSATSGTSAGGGSSVSSTAGPTVSASSTAAGTGGASATSSATTNASASTSGTGGAGGAGGGDPSIAFTVAPDTIAAGETVVLSVTVENFTLVAPGGANKVGEGHYHVYLDGATGGNYLTNGQTPTKMVTIPKGTTPGAHTLRVNITNNDHSPLNPPIESVMPITVK